jgi:hypothetical protein
VNQREEGFSSAEREALGLWRAAEPPADFAARVLAAAEVSGPGEALRSPVRGFAAAAVAALVLGGLWSLRGALEGLGPAGGEPAETPGFVAHPDGGRPEAAETRPALDGVEAKSS